MGQRWDGLEEEWRPFHMHKKRDWWGERLGKAEVVQNVILVTVDSV